MLKSALKHCEVEFGGLFRYEAGAFHAMAGIGVPKGLMIEAIACGTSKECSDLACLLEFKQPMHSPDLLASESYRARDPFVVGAVEKGGARAALLVPLVKDQMLAGAFAIYRKEPRAFTDKQVSLVTGFARQAVIAIENARLFEAEQTRTKELAESLEYQTAISDVLGVISRSGVDLQSVLETVVATAAGLCKAESAGIYRPNAGGDYLLAAGFSGVQTYQDREYVTPIRPGNGTLIGRAVVTRATVHIEDALADPDYEDKDYARIGKLRTLLGVPLMRDGEAIGVFGLARHEVSWFSERQVELVQTFADQAVIAIENARLLDELQTRQRELARSVEEMRALGEVGRAVSSSLDLGTVLGTILRHACEISHTGGGAIYVLDEARGLLTLEAGYNMSEELLATVRERPLGYNETAVGQCAARGEPVQLAEIPSASEHPVLRMLHKTGIRALLAVPLMHQGRAIGVLLVRRVLPGAFSQETVRLLETFASQSAIAVNNARLFQEIETRTKEVQQSLEYQTASNEVLKIISRSTFDLEPVLQAAIDTGVRLCKADMGSIFQLDGDVYRWRVGRGLDPAYQEIERANRIAVDDKTLVGRAVLARLPVHVDDAWTDASYAPRGDAKLGNVRTMLGVPMLRDGQPIGVFALARARLERFTEREISLVTTFADQAVIAIENVRLFNEIREKSRQLELASQHKSQFLANMSHELRTPLNAILGFTELMQDGIYGELPEKAGQVLGRVQTNGQHLLGLINSVLDLSKIEAGQLTLDIAEYSVSGVIEAVVVATESLALEKKLAMHADIAPDLPRGRGDERRLVQVLLNLVGNAIKFTDTGSVTISAERAGAYFRVAVRDTGPGIPHTEQARIFEEFHQMDNSNTKAKGGTGLGLAIAKRIVEMHGGRIWVDSRPGEGATFSFELPVRATQVEERRSETHTRH
jgi:signal transduction histidine kinase